MVLNEERSQIRTNFRFANVVFSKICIAVISFILGFATRDEISILYSIEETETKCSKFENYNIEKQEVNKEIEKAKTIWDLPPLSHSPEVHEVIPGIKVDAYNPFTNYVTLLNEKSESPFTFPELPLFHTWIHFLEAYHNHFFRYRGKEVVFMEVGVQSGGKIPLLRDYFGPGFTYIGLDISPGSQRFASADWVHIEIGSSLNLTFLEYIRNKYPKVDIFLDDGGHTMEQQKVAIQHMLPHVQPDGIFLCEDLGTSWVNDFNGRPNQDSRSIDFINNTMVGLVHKSMDWFMAEWRRGTVMQPEKVTSMVDSTFDESWWKVIPQQVKHIHYYNQMVVYEKGITHYSENIRTVGKFIPYMSKEILEPVDWDSVMKKIQNITKSSWNW